MEQFQNMSPEEAASKLLADYKGVQRNAEVKAWGYAEQFPENHDGRRYWVNVIRLIVYGGEFPVVARRPYVLNVPAAA